MPDLIIVLSNGGTVDWFEVDAKNLIASFLLFITPYPKLVLRLC